MKKPKELFGQPKTSFTEEYPFYRSDMEIYIVVFILSLIIFYSFCNNILNLQTF